MKGYASTAAFRAALEDRLRHEAQSHKLDLARLRRRLVLERVIARLEIHSPGRWVVKGGMALEVRLGDRARFTRDLDVVVRGSSDLSEIRDLLETSLAADPTGDEFDFALGESSLLDAGQMGQPGWRFPVGAFLAGRQFDSTKLDVVPRAGEVIATDRLPLPNRLVFADIPTVEVEVVDPRQHFAEKFHAFTRTYQGSPSTRIRDLPDMLLLLDDGLEPTQQLIEVIEAVFAARGAEPVPRQPPRPASPHWRDGYARIASELDLAERDLHEALRRLEQFWEEVLAAKR